VSSTACIAPPRSGLSTLPIDQRRGLWAMWAVIATEAMLFLCMFGAYYYLGNNKDRWSQESPPELRFPLILLVILLSSSFVLHWGERQVESKHFRPARIALWVTVLLGVVFLSIQSVEYYHHWSELAPYSDSYGSIFYTITSLHAAHVTLGLMMLVYVGILPRYGATVRTPHRPYSAVALYWHFVDVVWVFIVILLYVIPNLQRMSHVH